jgi:hypothetical protein
LEPPWRTMSRLPAASEAVWLSWEVTMMQR